MASPVKAYDENPLHYPVKKENSSFPSSKADCFYGLCEKSTYYGGKVVCGTFKRRNDRVMCCFFTLMCTALTIAVIAPLVLYSLVDSSINSEVVIDSTSAANYEAWQTNTVGSGFEDVKITYSLYYFDIQNAVDILAGAQPVVTEVGPYVFDEYFVKFDIEWKDNGDTVEYNTQKYYLFNQEKTGPGLTAQDSLLLPYPTAIGFEFLLADLPTSVNDAIDDYMRVKLTTECAYIQGNLTIIYGKIPDLPARKWDPVRQEVLDTQANAALICDRFQTFLNESNAVNLLFKTLLCGFSPGGLSPFFPVNPVDAWFGWLNDPVLQQVQKIVDMASEKSGEYIPWTSAVPGAAFNWTSVAETRRRRLPDTFKTGKKNKNQVSQYVKYNGMEVDKYHVCVIPYKSQVIGPGSDFVEGEQFPACQYWNNEWDEETAELKGYFRPFATPYANRLQGTDANMYGRPVLSDKIAVFVSDIYRSLFIEHQADVDWKGITLKRYGLQQKDMLNATANPENVQYYNFGPSGMENTTSAAGIPVFVSFPHFYEGDPRLVAAVKGLDPNINRHETFIDVEPQTGLLAHAEKKLQVNYLMESYYLPTPSEPDSADLANGVCHNITDLENKLIDSGVVDPSDVPTLSCDNPEVAGMFNCWAEPSDWKLQDDAIYFPYGWCSEAMQLPDSTADDLNNSLFLIDDLAEEIRFWSLVVAGLCFAILLAMVCNMWNMDHDQKQAARLRQFKQSGVSISGGESGVSTTEPLLAPSAPDAAAAAPTSSETAVRAPEYEPSGV